MTSPISPYRIVDESGSAVTYEYRSAYTWTLYVILAVWAVGIAIPNDTVLAIAIAAALIYFIAKLALGARVTAQIKQATQAGGVQITGSRFSFSNPLRIRVPK
jgi:hypothetical protein